jgi:uncharacterized protein YndB with AHSA1/START domain
VSSTCISRRVTPPRAIVYRALLDARAVATWTVPSGMINQVHAFDPRERGLFRISLRYDAPTRTSKTTVHTGYLPRPLPEARAEREGCRTA